MYEIYHHGIKGQKWGIRRFQDLTGKLTAAGRERYGEKSKESDNDGYAKLADANKKLLDEAIRRSTSGLKNGDKPEDVKNNDKQNQNQNQTTPDTTTRIDRPAYVMTDKELQNALNRLRNVDAYEKLLRERTPKSFGQELRAAGKKAAKDAVIKIGTNFISDVIAGIGEGLDRELVNAFFSDDKNKR